MFRAERDFCVNGVSFHPDTTALVSICIGSAGSFLHGVTSLYEKQRCNVMPHRKAHLPSKICPVCERPFSWRRKWREDWEDVKYCSKRCRGMRSGYARGA